MRIFALTLSVLFALNLFGQEEKLSELISRGVELHDQRKYEEAITQFNAALEIDNRSSLANYEISYSFFMTKQYDNAIKHSTIVIEMGVDHVEESYMVLGNSLDQTGKPAKAIKAYEAGLAKFPGSNLLNYNLALTCYNQKDFKKAEQSAIAAVTAKPEHGSSHILLSAVMQQTGQRVKSILPIYYFLMLEPGTNRSLSNYTRLKTQLGQGVEKKDDKNINVNISMPSKDDEFSAAEMMVSLLAASRHTEENKNKSEMDLFVETNKDIFSVLGEMKDDKKGFWWDFYVTKFYDLVQSNHQKLIAIIFLNQLAQRR